MTFTHRMATLAAVVLIPVGIAATSYLLSDDPAKPSVPAEVELSEDPSSTPSDSGSPDDTASDGPSESPSDTGSGTPGEPNEEVVPQPSTSEGSIDDDDNGNDDDGPGDGGDDDAGDDDG